jgi:hypothetical protein
MNDPVSHRSQALRWLSVERCHRQPMNQAMTEGNRLIGFD